MITVNELNKKMDGVLILRNVNLHMKTGSIYGLVGSNGSGKTTLLNHIAGVYRPDSGTILIDNKPVFETNDCNDKIAYITDDLSYLTSFSLKELSKFYQKLYTRWNQTRYIKMLSMLHLDEKRKLSNFSKGMQKQAAFVLAMSFMPYYLILDEPMDGLDQLVRKLLWNLIVEDVAERKLSVLVSSHHLMQLEGICDHIGILSKGQIILEQELDELKSELHKVQIAFPNDFIPDYRNLTILHQEKSGSLSMLIIKGNPSLIETVLKEQNPLVFDLLPLTLEEIFIFTLGGETNEYKDILF